MGLFNKIVNLLSDPIEEDEEEVVETPVKPSKFRKEEPIVKQELVVEEEKEEVEEVKKEVPKEKPLTSKEPERGLYQSKDTFKFPVFDDDEIESTLSKSISSVNNHPRELSRVNKEAEVRRSVDIPREVPRTEAPEVKEEKKVFRPSPVISPIYGILDKNYTKEDIKDKNEEISSTQTSVDMTNTTAVSYDVIRRKAYGTLEDELEDTISGLNKKETASPVKEVKKEIKELEDPKKHIEKLLDELEKTASMTVGEIEEALKNDMDDTDEYDLSDTLINSLETSSKSNVEEELEKTEEFKPREVHREEKKSDEDLENDLFNLIDSMYEEGDE